MTGALLAFLALSPAVEDTARFHQGVDYRIEVTLDESTHVLRGRARLRYTNRSPNALDTLWFHQHLNAFRPNSAWARRELEYNVRRFQDLGPTEHAFERLTSVQVNGRAVRPVYPRSPDSTVVAIPLSAQLRAGDSTTVLLDWTARLSTLPRRQGRAGRHYDWAHWYPRIAAYDHTGWAVQPLLPQGEFYGEFARYDVTLDLAQDQVVGSTGVAVEGNPGYTPTDFERGFYPASAAAPLGLLSTGAQPGRKRVRWRADNVHHFAWSADPTYRHESVTRLSLDDSGTRRDLPGIHVLYLPGDTAWDDNVVARRTYDALTWLQGIFGPYPWPQLTNVHRLESGGTEFPMLIMNGSASEGLIVHETAHQWLHGILANNEWREGWLDEGFTSFVTDWYWEQKGRADIWEGSMQAAAERERAGRTQPISLPAAEFANPPEYSYYTYTKPALVFRMLRELVGEPTFRQILRTYYDRHKLQHVTGADFERVASQVSGRDLGWFFAQWIRGTATLDYALTDARTEQLADGRWRTRATVTRTGDAWMPVTLQVGGNTRLLESRDRTQQVEIITPARPGEAVLDPRMILLDIQPTNNRRAVS